MLDQLESLKRIGRVPGNMRREKTPLLWVGRKHLCANSFFFNHHSAATLQELDGSYYVCDRIVRRWMVWGLVLDGYQMCIRFD